MQAIWDVAPPMTWAILGVAASFLLAGFVLLSHTLVRSKAYGDGFGGVLGAGRLEWTVRVGSACVLAGAALWSYELAAPAWLWLLLGAAAAAALALELAARART